MAAHTKKTPTKNKLPKKEKENGTKAFQEFWRLLAAARVAEEARSAAVLRLAWPWLTPQSWLSLGTQSPTCTLTRRAPHAASPTLATHFSLLSPFPFTLNTLSFLFVLSQTIPDNFVILKINRKKKKKKKARQISALRRGLWVVLAWGDVSGGCCCWGPLDLLCQHCLATVCLCKLKVQLSPCLPCQCSPCGSLKKIN